MEGIEKVVIVTVKTAGYRAVVYYVSDGRVVGFNYEMDAGLTVMSKERITDIYRPYGADQLALIEGECTSLDITDFCKNTGHIPVEEELEVLQKLKLEENK